MSEHLEGMGYREIAGQEVLATKGEPVYGEPTADGWRRWSTQRSKLASMVDRGLPVDLAEDARVLYLGAASGTTVSHLADVVEVVYAVEFAPRPMRELLEVAAERSNVIPLLKDARDPASYGHVVESGVDVLVQDVATRNQADVALRNRRFLRADGQLVLAIKARSEDVTASPAATFEAAIDRLEAGYEITHRERLEPAHRDHLGVLARPREDAGGIEGL